ncbi:MAG: TAT-variant-translocated molybdopterin oxidoreductase [Acidobacteriota bacterium]
MRLSGAALGTLWLENCRPGPVEYAIPYLVPPEGVVPGEPVFYTSVCQACPAGCGLLAKCVDGRPIKLEGNPEHPASRGALCALGQAALWELYDPSRPQEPLCNGEPVAWEVLDRGVREGLETAQREGKEIVVLTGTINSPSLEHQLQRFLEHYGARWICYDACSSSAMAAAHELTHGVRALPDFRLERADVIVAVEADFLGPWLAPVEFAQAYRDGRSLETSRLRLSRHYHFESRRSLTGVRADVRRLVYPGEEVVVLAGLARRVAERRGRDLPLPEPSAGELDGALLDEIADQLVSSARRSLVLCGLQDLTAQVLANVLNELLGNYGRTLDIAYPSFRRRGWEADLETLQADLEAARVGALLVLRCDPVFELPWGDRLAPLLAKVPLTLLATDRPAETAGVVRYLHAEPHFLERWEDSQPTARILALGQPVVYPRGNTRSLLAGLEAWLGGTAGDYEVVRRVWAERIHSRQVGVAPFEDFWNATLAKGVANVRPERQAARPFDWGVVEGMQAGLEASPSPADRRRPVLLLHPSDTLGDGGHSHNPWLQELPDPLTGAAWGPVARYAPGFTAEAPAGTGRHRGLRLGGRSGGVELSAAEDRELPPGVCSAPLGYGRADTVGLHRAVGPASERAPAGSGPVGCNLYRFVEFRNGFFRYRVPVEAELVSLSAPTASVRERLPEWEEIEVERRDSILRRLTLPELLSRRSSATTWEEAPGLWPEDHRRRSGHHWAMVIDLGACTGCGACVVACQAENNIPCVGAEESRRGRSLHWIRIDRYEAPEERAGGHLVFQPMLCQHCDHAPCEVVCPVLATVHSSEGLNEQIYNRCIGTRYCANNCPYKVRVFNWFTYRDPLEAEGENPLLNPEVAVRSRGVMEKCTFCVQRIERARVEEKMTGELPAFQTACQQTCPSRAIVFGDLNDPKGPLAPLLQSPRRYRVLEELGTRPSVFYLAEVRHGKE